MFESVWNSIKKNHIAQMAICCLLPVVLIVALTAAGFSGPWLFGLALVACVGAHLVMGFLGSKEDGKCH